ncbi:MAG: riboflavin synthase [Elusimicrobiota bacterium]|nr:riboflavin synthase [Elusimicrobiota bacterium]
MFTGIIEAVEKIKTLSGKRLEINMPGKWQLSLGESIAINGICLTVSEIKGTLASFDISPETINKTNFKYLSKGKYVNIERALRVGDRISGHFVSGHIDGVRKLYSLKKIKDSFIFEFEARNDKYLIEKGSVALNGISLTVFDLKSESFKIAVINHTYQNTYLRYASQGDFFNIEFDMLGKYALKGNKTEITRSFLSANGF